mmetsp:Transcript_21253/g.67888  ORF Transcript_21253/g.67888 Transcript_21253/m.67888 type:complete len:259 (+) Transcript_21253:126-902(+)
MLLHVSLSLEAQPRLGHEHGGRAAQVREARLRRVKGRRDLEPLDPRHRAWLARRLPLVLRLHARSEDRRHRREHARRARVRDTCVLARAKGAVEGGLKAALRHLCLYEARGAHASQREHVRVQRLPPRLEVGKRDPRDGRGAPLRVEGAVGDYRPLRVLHEALLKRHRRRNKAVASLPQRLPRRRDLPERCLYVHDLPRDPPAPSERRREGDVRRAVTWQQRCRLADLLQARRRRPLRRKRGQERGEGGERASAVREH